MIENDLISRSALLKDREYCDCPSCEDGGDCGFCYIPVEAVKNAPAVDALLIPEEVDGKAVKFIWQKQDGTLVSYAPVVRCTECYKRNKSWCPMRDNGMGEDDFCSYGDRREDDGK